MELFGFFALTARVCFFLSRDVFSFGLFSLENCRNCLKNPTENCEIECTKECDDFVTKHCVELDANEAPNAYFEGAALPREDRKDL